MQARIRDAAARARKAAETTVADRFGAPTAIRFGATAVTGDARDAAGHALFANAAHEHAVPELPDTVLEDFDDFVVLFHDMALTDDPQADPPQDLSILIQGTGSDVTTGGFDGTGEAAAFGSLLCTAGPATTRSAGAFITETAGSADTRTDNVYARRMRRFECRIRPALTQATLANRLITVGAFLTSTNGVLTTITTGLYFRLETNASGVGTWTINATVGSSTRSKDTGVSPRVLDGDVLFDTLRIDYDGDTATFAIGYFDPAEDRTVFASVGQLDDNIPDSSNFVFGWGAAINPTTAASVEMVLDFMLYKGVRVAS